MNVAVTGAGSTVARPVIAALERDPGIESILALDIRPYQGIRSAKIRSRIADVRDRGALLSAFTSVSAVIHLAFVVVTDVPDGPTIREINIEGSRRVLHAAADSGVQKVIYTSSVAAYGAVPGNPPVLTEDAPCRGLENERNFYYAYTKAAVEQIMEDFARSHPDIVVTRFRSSILVGPRILEDSYQLRLLSGLAGPSRSFWGFRPVGANGRLAQYTHEGDLSEAVLHALHHEMPGAYNIAGEPLDLESYLRSKGKTFRPIPWAPAHALAWLLSPFSSRMRLARAWLVSARYRNILDCSKLRRSGFGKTLRTTFECLEDVTAFLAESRAAGAKETHCLKVDR
jgi:nucleoside-diphosphate-sugar epimerase